MFNNQFSEEKGRWGGVTCSFHGVKYFQLLPISSHRYGFTEHEIGKKLMRCYKLVLALQWVSVLSSLIWGRGRTIFVLLAFVYLSLQ